ncbi:DUF4158 domain-containing protein [Streptomyces amakusaensis]|uniref:DUF4158 domain-containing protein n=1 Tax=Streptomyces amakusaensis TaxID=67271 RepID=A0ABW0ANB5_9ACTN
MTSIERTAYPRFKRLITARELHVFFTPSEEERAWAEEAADSDEHQLALLPALKSYQRMGCFPKAHDVPEQVVEFVRRAAALPEDTLPVYGSERTAKSQRSMVRRRCGMRYDGPGARALAEETMRIEAASKNNPADLINIALEKLVEAGLEIPRFSTLDAMASTVRARPPGRGPPGRPARPRPGLPVPDRAHQAVRRVLHPRTRHHPRRLRRPPGRRLQRPRRRRQGSSSVKGGARSCR